MARIAIHPGEVLADDLEALDRKAGEVAEAVAHHPRLGEASAAVLATGDVMVGSGDSMMPLYPDRTVLVVERQPLEGDYRGYHIVTAPPPSTTMMNGSSRLVRPSTATSTSMTPFSKAASRRKAVPARRALLGNVMMVSVHWAETACRCRMNLHGPPFASARTGD